MNPQWGSMRVCVRVFERLRDAHPAGSSLLRIPGIEVSWGGCKVQRSLRMPRVGARP